MSTATVPRATGYPVPASGAALNSAPVRTQIVNIVDFLEGGNIAQGNIDSTEVAALAVSNTWTANQTINATLTVGADDTGYDVKLFGATASKFMVWDESADDLILADGVALQLGGDESTADGFKVEFDGTATLAIDALTANDKVSIGATTSTDFWLTSAGGTVKLDASADTMTSAGIAWDLTAGTFTTTGTLSAGATTVTSLNASDGNITNVGNIALDSITADGGASADITLDTETAGSFIVNGNQTDTAFEIPASGGTNGMVSAFSFDADNVGLFFDAHYSSGFKSKDAGSSFGFYKQGGDILKLVYDTAAVDGAITWNTAVSWDVSGQATFSTNTFFGSSSSIFIGDTANANMTQGLTINQDTNDNIIFGLKSSDVATGLTSAGGPAETDDFLNITKAEGSTGGVRFRSYMEDAAQPTSFAIEAYGGTATTTKTTSGVGLFDIYTAEHNGSNAIANTTADGNVFTVRTYQGAQRTCFLVDEDGDIYSITAAQTFDSHDDVALIDAYDKSVDPKGAIRGDFAKFAGYNEQTLIDAGVLGAPISEGGMTNVTQLQRLHNGAIRQIAEKLYDALDRLQLAESKLKMLEV